MTRVAQRLSSELQRLVVQNGRAVLVIDGDCAAGKTTLAAQIAALLPCTVFHMDDFFLPPSLRTPERLSEAGGNIDYDRFLAQVLKPLLSGQPFTYGAYSCKYGETRYQAVTPQPAVIIEGSYALHPCFLATYQALGAVKVFLYLQAEEQFRRILRRNGAEMLRRFREEWIPMEKQYQFTYGKSWGDVRRIDGVSMARPMESK
jgi:uridine kinase